jgi:hypothetical protein
VKSALPGVEYHSAFNERLKWFKGHVAPLDRACIVYSGERQELSRT